MLKGRPNTVSSPLDKMSARRIGTDTWEVSLPKRRSALAHRASVRPRHVVHAKSWDEAMAMGREVFAREEIAYLKGCTMDVFDLVMFFIDDAERRGVYSRDTAADYRGAVRRYVRPNLKVDADKVTRGDIESLYAFLLESGAADGGGLSPNTVHKLHTVLRAAFEYMEAERIVASSPMHGARFAPRERNRRRSLTEREFAKVMDAIDAELSVFPDPGDAAAILWRNCVMGAALDVRWGIRVGEMCAIRRGDVRFVPPIVTVDGSMSERGGLHRGPPKTESGKRSMHMDAQTIELIEGNFEWQKSYLSARARDSDATPLLTTANGDYIRPSVMSAAFKSLCAEVGVELRKGESFHLLRHTNTTMLLSDSFNPELARQRAGHSRIETTFRYGHVLTDDDERAAERFSKTIEKVRASGSSR